VHLQKRRYTDTTPKSSIVKPHRYAEYHSQSMALPKEIHIAAAVITREDGNVLLVRKRDTVAFMQPGGKIEPGEKPVDALCRELREELQLQIERSSPGYLQQFSALAANEPDHTVIAEVFHVAMTGPVEPAAEIEEIVWVDPAAPGTLNLAPLTQDHILPFWLRLSATKYPVGN
jgi:8-oxo-dGTP diphosphatase